MMQRTKTLRVAIIALIALALGFAVFFYARPDVTAVDGSRITIHFTCDTSGRLEPCGCFTGQHGGLTRLRTWLDGRRDPGLVLKLDAGGALAGQADYDVIQHRFIARAYHNMGFAALNMGRDEAMLSAARLRELATSAAVPLVSASLVDETTREGVLKPHQTVTLGGLRIGILGVVSPTSVPAPGEGLAVLSLNEAIDRHLPALAEDSDLVILLAFATEPEMRRIARDYYEFALILGGDVAGPAPELLRENDSIILYTTNEARTVGTLTARLDGGPRTRLLDAEYAIELLRDTIPHHPEILALVQDYRLEIRNTTLAVDADRIVDPNAIPGVAATASFVGSQTCQSCHPKAHEVWSNSGHAHAFETLVKLGSEADPQCIGCHTVGFGRDGGYRRPMGSSSLVDVGCESCHGPGSEHVDRYLHGKPNNFRFRPLGPGDCKSCHYGEFSRPFDWDTFWPPVSHGSEAEMARE
jgi:hypothetical protein